jgi:hypothetical protein
METGRSDKEDRTISLWLRSKKASWGGLVKEMLTKPAYPIILISNAAIFFIPGFDLKTQATTFLYIYLIQSLLIGLVHVLKLNFYRFAPASRPTDWKSPHALSLFFMVHFGFFHFVYTFFIPAKNVDWNLVLYGSLINISVLIINTIRHYSRESNGHYNANDFMFLPYVRIVPIHMAIIIGTFFSAITGNFAPVMVTLAVIKTAMEIGLEYLQYLGVSFSSLQELNKE